MRTLRLKYYLIFFAFLLLAFLQHAMGQELPEYRKSDWSKAGLVQAVDFPFHRVDFVQAGGKNDGKQANDSLLAYLMAQAPIVIYFPAGSYAFTHTIDIPSNVVLRGESADSVVFHFDLRQEAALLALRGQAGPDTLVPSASSAFGDSVIELSTPTVIQPGALYQIIDNDSALVSSPWALASTGQLVTVDSFAGNKLFLKEKIRRPYLLSQGLKLIEIQALRNVAIENISLRGSKATSIQSANILLDYAYNCRLHCVDSRMGNFAHVDIRHSAHVELSGSYFQDAHSYGNGGHGYGVVLHHGSSDCLVKDNVFNHLRHAMLLQAGANGNVLAYNYSLNPYWTGVALPSNAAGDLVLHGNYPYRNLMEGNVVQNIVIDDSHGKNGPHNVFLRNRAELYGIFMNNNPATDSLVFIANETTATGLFFGNIILNGTGHWLRGNSEKGVLFPSGTTISSIHSLMGKPLPEYSSTRPLIGPPTALNRNQNRVQKRYSQGLKTLCANSLSAATRATAGANEGPAFLLMPNPASSYIILRSLRAVESRLQYAIFDGSGRLMRSNSNYSPGQKISLSGLSAGFYFISIMEKGRPALLMKFVRRR